MRYVDLRGNIWRDAPYKGYYGVRPAFYLDAEYYTVLQGKGTESEPYVGTVKTSRRRVSAFLEQNVIQETGTGC